MKSTLELLSRLRSLHIQLHVGEDRLCCDAPEGVMTDELQAELRDHKASLILVLQSAQDSKVQATESIQPTLRNSRLSLSFAQQRFWFLDQLEPGNIAYQIIEAIRITGVLNIKALDQALQEIVRRHEVLRTRFPSKAGTPTPIIDSPSGWRTNIKDLRGFSEPRRASLTQDILMTEAHQPFNLSNEPLFRAQLLRLTDLEQILVFTMHHIVWDGWSFGIFLDEMGRLYNSFNNRQPSPLPALPIQYVDYASWQREWFQGEILATQLEYWRKQLSGELPTLSLPNDRPRPPKQTFQGAEHPLVIPRSLKNQLLSLNQDEGTTPFMTLLAAFQALLVRYTGQEDLLIGCPIANRTRLETEELIGPFANTLVLRTDCSGNPRFRELLTRGKEVALGAFAHQDIPFELLIEQLQIPRELSFPPLFQVMFVYQNVPMGNIDSPGLSSKSVEFPSQAAMFDLTVWLWDGENGEVKGTVEYNTDLFEPGTIDRWVKHYQKIIEEVGKDPDQRISEIPLSSPTEFQQIIEQGHGEEANVESTNLSAVFQAQVSAAPDTVAMVSGEHQLTYEQLSRRVDQLAHHLQQKGVRHETRVGVCLERGIDLIVSLLAILKIGGAYVPFNPAYPKERLAYMLTDTDPAVLLSQQSVLERLPAYEGSVLCIDSSWPTFKQEAACTPPHATTANTLAYVMYTSGSTGQPKGVKIEQGSLSNFLHSMSQRLAVTKSDVFLGITPITFDIAALELFLPLLVGARVMLVNTEEARDGQRLMEQLQISGSTIIQATPATWHLLLQAGWQGNRNLKILCGGETLTRDLAEKLLVRSQEVWNLYGPTETTVWATIHKVCSGKETVPIGRPIDNTQTYILDKDSQIAPIGIPGELHIGGQQVARGYLHRPALTAEKFIPNPFTHVPGARVYRTGDQARWREKGSLEILGRQDNQIKLRGYRIELGEIESILQKHEQIDAVKVIVREDIPGDKRIVAYLVTYHGLHLDVADLKQFTRERVPDFMVPSAFVRLNNLPLTMNGKINNRAFPVPHSHDFFSEKQYVAPQNELEKTISHVWQHVLGMERIGVHDNFFDLGGHSMLSVQVHQHLCNTLKRQFPVIALFQYPTIHTIAQFLGQKDTPSQISIRATRSRAERQKQSFAFAKFYQKAHI